jgi:predicted lipoprotein with Yx(FWY)xxD motif
MKKKLFIPGGAVALVAIAIAVAGCGGGGGGGSATAAMPSTSGKTVAVADIGSAGKVLVNSSGQALYASDQETSSGKAMCTGACNSFWKPLTVSGGAPTGSSDVGKLGVVKRPDGTMQVTDNGRLLYTFTQEGPGQVTGDGFQDAFNGQHFTWHVVSVGNGGSASSISSSSGGSSSSGSFSY